MQSINSHIYAGMSIVEGYVGCDPYAIKDLVTKQEMRELYGDNYNRLKDHKPYDLEVADLLINDALKTGKWKELPQCLYDRYHAEKEKLL